MTTFPLPPNFFRCPELSVDEKEYMVNLAQKSLIDLVRHANLEGGPIKWSLDSDEAGLKIFMGQDPAAVGSEMTFILSTTEIMASLDEVASLFRSDTTETFREYTRNFGKDLLDAQSLYTLARPSAENPRHFIGVKWMVLEVPQGFAKNRDMCYLECQDDFEMNGRRGWARSLNSIKLPCCPDLQSSLGLVRASMYRTGFVFLETDRPGYLQAMHAVQIDLKGSIPKFIVKIGARRRARSIADIDQFLREKRLSGEVFLDRKQLVATSARSKCFLCSKKFGPFSKKKNCRKCGEVVCTSCSKYWDINVNGLGRSMIRVCTACSIGTFHKGLPPLMSAYTDNMSEQSTDYHEEGRRVLSRHSHHTPKMARGTSLLQRPPQEVSVSISSKQSPFERRREPEPEAPLIAANRHLLPAARSVKVDGVDPAPRLPGEFVSRGEEWSASEKDDRHDGARLQEARQDPRFPPQYPDLCTRTVSQGSDPRFDPRATNLGADPRFDQRGRDPEPRYDARPQPRELDRDQDQERDPPADPRNRTTHKTNLLGMIDMVRMAALTESPASALTRGMDMTLGMAKMPGTVWIHDLGTTLAMAMILDMGKIPASDRTLRYGHEARYGQDPRYDHDPRYGHEPRYGMDPRGYAGPDARYHGQYPRRYQDTYAEPRSNPRLLEAPTHSAASDDGERYGHVRDSRAPSATSEDDAGYRGYAQLNAQNLAAFTAQGGKPQTEPRGHGDSYARFDERRGDFGRPIYEDAALSSEHDSRDRFRDDRHRSGDDVYRPPGRDPRFTDPRYYDTRDGPRFNDPRYMDPRQASRYYDQRVPAPRYMDARDDGREDPRPVPPPPRADEPKAAPRSKAASDLAALAQQMEALGVKMDPATMTPQQLKALYAQLQKLNLDEPPAST
ncbi:hypothetical protein ACHHYP_15440 [Achlya hypogyna]|uniref:FYVE-type domain-containing protein n=1 Tax=Achlya hypogyna TaxID=1202772 RepID=A0A1V9YAU8_ACHHY|nr:hypothetical protein ACHHYP_15440 [Achlya hypogyna]